MKNIKKFVAVGTLVFAGCVLANLVAKVVPTQYVAITNDCFSIALLIILIISKPKFGHLRTTTGIIMSLATLFPVVLTLSLFSSIHAAVNAAAAMGVVINGRESDG